MWCPAGDYLNIRFATIKRHESALLERNREAGDGAELIGADLPQCAAVVKEVEVPEGSAAVEGEGRLVVFVFVAPHHSDLGAPRGCRVDGVMVADRLDGRIAFVEGDLVPSWICFYL